MSDKVIVLGAKGRFGRAAVSAFVAAGWHVTAAGRNMRGHLVAQGVSVIDCDVMDKANLIQACSGFDVIVNAVNPPYDAWAATVPVITANVIKAAKASGATIMLPGNVYNYGAQMPEILREDTVHRPTTRKGHIRVDMEQAHRDATKDGVQTIVLRGGDFIEGVDTGNWFETYITSSVSKGKFMYPGRNDISHAWAYLPDMARALALLAARRENFASFEEFGFDGFSATGREVQGAVERHIGQPLRRKYMPWGVIRVLALFQPMMREVLEMRYLWDIPHRLDGTKLNSIIGDFQRTTLDDCIASVIEKPSV
jgi:nucleoside-diphosphate-sugar epimerase